MPDPKPTEDYADEEAMAAAVASLDSLPPDVKEFLTEAFPAKGFTSFVEAVYPRTQIPKSQWDQLDKCFHAGAVWLYSTLLSPIFQDQLPPPVQEIVLTQIRVALTDKLNPPKEAREVSPSEEPS